MTHGFSPKHLLVPLAAESLGCGKCGSQKAGFVLGSCARAAPAHWRAPLDPHLGPALGNDQQQALTSGKALLAPDDSSGADVGLTSSWGGNTSAPAKDLPELVILTETRVCNIFGYKDLGGVA